jgi:hypothetical protein
MSLFVPFLDVFNFLLDMHHSTEFFLWRLRRFRLHPKVKQVLFLYFFLLFFILLQPL